ncbi:MAG TPA: PP0621 family protein [SAR86 cluster bacterium]|nr:PP0621 family protein [SAR86 cluster bacterium]|tara:strand:- start:255 stop:452 length:198 start_codon:yes stop_codon:yes gene_type:complete
MFQILILIAVITLVYIIGRSLSKPKENLTEKSTEMVKCKKCGLNLPKSEAIISEGLWYCSDEHKN